MPRGQLFHRYLDEEDEYEWALRTYGIAGTQDETPRLYQGRTIGTTPTVHSRHGSHAAYRGSGFTGQLASIYRLDNHGSLVPEITCNDKAYNQRERQYCASWQGPFVDTECCSSTGLSAYRVNPSFATPNLAPKSVVGQNNQCLGIDAHDPSRWSYSVSDYPRELRDSIALNEIMSGSIILSRSETFAERSLMTPPPSWQETVSTEGQLSGPLFPPGYEHLLPDSRPVSASFEETAYRLASPIEISTQASPNEPDECTSQVSLPPQGSGVLITSSPPAVSPPMSSQSPSSKRARQKYSSPHTPRKSNKDSASRANHHPTGKSCLDCHTTSTPLWRKDGKGGIFCNKCGIRRSRAKSRGTVVKSASSQCAGTSDKPAATAAVAVAVCITTAAPLEASVPHTHTHLIEAKTE